MLRKILTISFMIVLSIAAYSEPISKEMAQKMAEEFFYGGSFTKASSSTLVWTGPGTPTKADATDIPFYVYNFGDEGFVMVAADDAVEPILAYSHEHGFKVDGMPKEIYAWYKAKADIIDYAKKNGLKSSGRPVTKASSGVLLQTANWAQGKPFNNFCPTDSGGKTATGCTNTAAAIVMRYYSYPEKGTGTIPSYKYTSQDNTIVTLPEIPLGHTYDWDNMPLDGPYSEKQGNEIARLMYELGVMNESYYGSEGTGAYSEWVRHLAIYYGYDKSVKYYYRDGFTDQKWEQIIRDALDDSHPVLMSGYNKDWGGHSFVIDGYRNEHFFHINFGWGSAYNTYEVLTPIVGKENQLIEFYQGQTIIPNLYPDAGGNMDSSFTLTSKLKIEWDDNNAFTIKAPSVYNETFLTEGTFMIGLVDKDNKLLKVVGDEVTVSTEWKGYPSSFSVTLTGVLNEVDDLTNKLALCCKVGDSYELVHQTDDYMIRLAYGDELEDMISITYSKATGSIIVTKPSEMRVDIHNGSHVIKSYNTSSTQVEIKSSENFFNDSYEIIVVGRFEHKGIKITGPTKK